MKHNILTVSNAAEIIGIDERTVLGWCKNNVINCQDAPAEYSDKTKYLIEEDECDYIKSLISKFGARNALLNYKKGGEILLEIWLKLMKRFQQTVQAILINQN